MSSRKCNCMCFGSCFIHSLCEEHCLTWLVGHPHPDPAPGKTNHVMPHNYQRQPSLPRTGGCLCAVSVNGWGRSGDGKGKQGMGRGKHGGWEGIGDGAGVGTGRGSKRWGEASMGVERDKEGMDGRGRWEGSVKWEKEAGTEGGKEWKDEVSGEPGLTVSQKWAEKSSLASYVICPGLLDVCDHVSHRDFIPQQQPLLVLRALKFSFKGELSSYHLLHSGRMWERKKKGGMGGGELTFSIRVTEGNEKLFYSLTLDIKERKKDIRSEDQARQ